MKIPYSDLNKYIYTANEIFSSDFIPDDKFRKLEAAFEDYMSTGDIKTFETICNSCGIPPEYVFCFFNYL